MKNSPDTFLRDWGLKDAAAIRKLWKNSFDKSNRKRGEKSAEWFAAKRLEELTQGEIKASGLLDVLNAAKKR